MKKALQLITDFASAKKGSKIVILIWIAAAFLLAFLAPGSKEFAVNVSGSGLPDNAKSVVAEKKLQHYFTDEGGLPALLLFKQKEGITEEGKKEIAKLIETFGNTEKYPSVKEVVPYGSLPPAAQDSFLSKDKTIVVVPVILKDNLEMKTIQTSIDQFKKVGKKELPDDLKLTISGPGGIAADSLKLFSNADIVLMLSTVGIILVLLILIYRSPLLAFIPLLIAGIVYEVVDKVLGIFGDNGLHIEKQSLSIMMILLFATITDYSLFVFSRYREQLRENGDKFISMKKAMEGVGEPIFFSAGTVFTAMLILFTAIYTPYQNFAPVFSIAMFIILLAGITLIPAFFTLFGRKAFWPSIPKVGDVQKFEKGIWAAVAKMVTKRPVVSGGMVLMLLAVAAFYMTNINYSFNLIKSFPTDMESRVGFDMLEGSFSKGELAPTDVLLAVENKGDLSKEKVEAVRSELEKQKGVEKVSVQMDRGMMMAKPQGDPYAAKEAVKLKLTFKSNPYEIASLDAMDHLRDHEKTILKETGMVSGTHLYFAGETAKQADVRALNNRDTSLTVALITILILLLLMVQTRSLLAPIYMMATILISYTSAMGISYFLFEKVFGYDAMSYRIPLYAFVFLVALGVDYNIMLMSRIQEELKTHALKEAVQRGLTKTGGVISSAGLILAATFGVLITQPIMELFMFGTVMAIGVIIDTFIVRGILVPSIMLLIGKWNFWPRKTNV